MPVNVVIDTDPGIDDALALALAATYDDLDIAAITTVQGNTDVARATRNARLVARMAALSAPVFPGAARPLRREPLPARETHGPEGLGYVQPDETAQEEEEAAAAAIVRLARGRPGLLLCCLGPLTNLARALALEADLPRQLGPVVVMGGALGVRGTQTRWSEFNWWADPESVEIVLHAGLDLRIVPLDVTRRVALSRGAVDRLREHGTRDEAARFWAEALGFYVDFRRQHASFTGFVVNDALAVALMMDPTLAGWEHRRISVSTTDDERRGSLVVEPEPPRADGAGAMVRIAVSVQARAVLELLHRRLFARWMSAEELCGGADAAGRLA